VTMTEPDAPYRKGAVPQASRRTVALRAGAVPGGTSVVLCHYCATPGTVYWPQLASGRPGAWVAFGELELDHVIPESHGGTSDADNLVLACRPCNRRKGARVTD
jgi:5-methylcytosine-specific restriction endonuclease McrA